MLIGEIIGTVSTSGFKFQAYNEIKKFDFVTVKKEDRWILSQVQEVWKHDDGRTEAEAMIIGYREKGLLKKPRSVIKPNSMVYLADEDIISETLGLDKKGLYIGKLESNANIKVHLNPKSFFRHIAILAQTGAGKSYLTGVVIEELLERKMPVVIIDPHGEYGSLSIENDELSDEDRAKFEIEPKSYDVEEYSIDIEINPHCRKLSFSDKNLDPQEINQMLPTSLNNSQMGLLYTCIKNMEKEYSLKDIIDACMKSESKAKWSLINLLEVLNKSGIFSEECVDVRNLINPGVATVINLRGVEPKIQEAVVYKLCKEIFSLRKKGLIPPLILVVEEAHNYVPERNLGTAISSHVLMNIASEGRKFGLGLVIVSQRPARIDNNVLSQCNSQIIMRLTNPNDLNAVSKSFEGITNSVKKVISSLPSGVGVVLGNDYPLITEIRARRTKHLGDSGKMAMSRIYVLKPKVEKSNVLEVYYPLWLVKSKNNMLIIDGKDGTVKYSRLDIDENEMRIYRAIKGGFKDMESLMKKFRMGLSDLNNYLSNLVKRKMIKILKKDGKISFEEEKIAFEEEIVEIIPKNSKVIKEDIDKEKALQIGRKYLKDSLRAKLIYYPYYADENKIIDRITKEVI